MLRKVISGLIEGVIGSYVEDVNSEKLSIGLLNGNLSLSQLQLKRDTLHRLFDIPLVLEKGMFPLTRLTFMRFISRPWEGASANFVSLHFHICTLCPIHGHRYFNAVLIFREPHCV
ncbi:hypothetical protein PHET_12217 [Paragonimus heterotremus]|uniref:Chorein N-terminal domain-containing protein n=1 Tax=Paragonimus heterotremus TaxID=100268 RepID=A0A8J4T5P1_9TREM|nr:hypothetical protein PHET_12217 [Paragonimus heterotremus]